MSKEYFPDDARIKALLPVALEGDPEAVADLREIYDRGKFDPGFGRELEAFLSRVES